MEPMRTLPSLSDGQGSRFFPNTVCRPGLVRSAKTGIQYPPELTGWGKTAEAAGYWIPACAGMTRRVGWFLVREVLTDWSVWGHCLRSAMVRLPRLF